MANDIRQLNEAYQKIHEAAPANPQYMDDEMPDEDPPYSWHGEEDIPDQCWNCGKYQQGNDKGKMIPVDFDPGDAEVGPQPDIGEAWICDECLTYKGQHGHLPRVSGPRLGDIDEPRHRYHG